MAYISAEERRSSFVDAAIEVIAAEGFANATTRRIAAQAGASLGSIHYCFRGKDELMEAVLERGVEEIGRSLDAVDPEEGIGATIRALAHARWTAIRQDVGLHLALTELLMWAIRQNKPSGRLYDLVNDPYGADRTRRALTDAALAEGKDLAVPAHELTRFLNHRLDGLILEYAVSRDDEGCSRQVELLAQALTCLAVPA